MGRVLHCEVRFLVCDVVVVTALGAIVEPVGLAASGLGAQMDALLSIDFDGWDAYLGELNVEDVLLTHVSAQLYLVVFR